MDLARLFLNLQSSPGMEMRFLYFSARCFLAPLFIQALQVVAIPSSRPFLFGKASKDNTSLHLKHDNLDDNPSLTFFISSALFAFSGSLCLCLWDLDLSLAFSLFLSLLLYSEIQERHQLDSPDLTLLFGAKESSGRTFLHLEHDLFMRRMIPSL